MIHISVSFFNTLIGDFLLVSFFMRSHWRGAREITTGASAASASNTRLPPTDAQCNFHRSLNMVAKKGGKEKEA